MLDPQALGQVGLEGGEHSLLGIGSDGGRFPLQRNWRFPGRAATGVRPARPRSTRPLRSARAASTISPVRTICMAKDLPTRRGRRWVPPSPGNDPILISGVANFAPSAAITMSQSRASSSPPPNAKPLTAAMRGFRKVLDRHASRPAVRDRRRIRPRARACPRCRRRRKRHARLRSGQRSRLAHRPLPLRPLAASCFRRSFDNALSFSGRFSVSNRTRPRRSTRTRLPEDAPSGMFEVSSRLAPRRVDDCRAKDPTPSPRS